MRDLSTIEENNSIYEACIQGKQHRLPFPVGKAWRAKEPLELVHTNVCGPMRTPSLDQNRYFILLIDDYTKMTWVYVLCERSQVFENFKKWKNIVEKMKEVEHQLTVECTLEQNGLSTRKNRRIMEMA